MAKLLTSVTVNVKLAWWLRPYLAALQLACMVTGAQPDWVKFERVVARAIRVS